MESLRGGKRHVSVGEDQMLRQLSRNVEQDDIEQIRKLLREGVPFMDALRQVAKHTQTESAPTFEETEKEITDTDKVELTY